jgi:hypothetical protein
MDGTHLKDKAAWAAFKADQEKRCRWSSDAEPTQYPVIVIVHYDYDHRYAQNKLCFDFVYLEQFLDHVDRSVWHLYCLDGLSKYLGEVTVVQNPSGFAFVTPGTLSAWVVVKPTMEFDKNGVRVSGTGHDGDETCYLLTQLRIPDHEVEWLE